MYCNNCGNEVAEGTKFCPNCGALIGINSNINVANSQQTYKGNGDDEKENIFILELTSPGICNIIIACVQANHVSVCLLMHIMHDLLLGGVKIGQY